MVYCTEINKKISPNPHLAKGALSNERVDLVAIHPFLSRLDDVVVVVVIVTVVIETSFLLVARVFTLGLLCPSLLLSIVYLQENISHN